MRKFLMAVAIGGLVLLVAAPAMALDFKFGAEYRVRFYDYTNDGFDSSNSFPIAGGGNNPGASAGRGNPRGVQVRVRPRFDVSDDNGNIQATIRFEYGDTDWGAGGGNWGYSFGTNRTNIQPGIGSTARVGNNAGGGLGADGVGLETKWAYIDFAMPMNIPLRVRAGIQGLYLPKGLVIDDDAAAVRAYGKTGIVDYDFWWARAARSVATSVPPAGAVGRAGFDSTRDSSFDIYTAKVGVNVATWLQPSLYFSYVDNRVNCSEPTSPCVGTAGRDRSQYYLGLSATGKASIVEYDLDFVYGVADGGPTGAYTGINGPGNPINVRGWALDGGVHIPIGPVKLNLLGTYSSGDKNDGGDSEAYPTGIAPSWSGAGGQYELIGEGGAFDVVSMTQHTPTNLWMLGFTVEYVPVKALWLKFAYGYAGFSEKYGNCAVGVAPGSNGCFGPVYVGKPSNTLAGKSGLGHEVHLRADYTMWTGFKVQGMVGWLFPNAGDVAGKYILQLLYNF